MDLSLGMHLSSRLFSYPNSSELIAAYDGLFADLLDVDTDIVSTYLKAKGRTSAIAQVKASSVAGDGSGWGKLIDGNGDAVSVTLVGDFEVSGSFEYVSGSYQATLGGDDIIEGIIGYISIASDAFRVYIDGNAYLFSLLPLVDGQHYQYTLVRSDSTLTLAIVGLGSQSLACSTANITLRKVMAWKATPAAMFLGNLCDLKASDSTGPKIDLAMTCKDSSVEWSSNPDIDVHCEWSGFLGDVYEEHTDGSGSNRANEDGFSLRENLIFNSHDLTAGQWYASDGAQINGESSLTLAATSNSRVENETLYFEGSSVVGKTFTAVSKVRGSGECKISIKDASTWDTTDGSLVLNDEYQIIYVTRTIAAGATGIISGFRNLSLAVVTVEFDGYAFFEGTIDDWDGTFPQTAEIAITGRQPANFQNLPTQYPGPIPPHGQLVNIACLDGDGSGGVNFGQLDITNFTGITMACRVDRSIAPVITEMFFAIKHTGNDDIRIYGTSSDDVRFGIDDGAAYDLISDTGIATSVDTLILTFDGSTLKGYVDGVVVDSISANFAFSTADGTVSLLQRNDGTLIADNASIWDACIYNRAISAAEALSWHSETIKDDSLVFRVPCENGHPTSYPDANIIEDVVGGNHGTATGFLGSPWGTRDTGVCALAGGYSVDRVIGDELFDNPPPDPEELGGTSFWTRISQGTYSRLSGTDNALICGGGIDAGDSGSFVLTITDYVSGTLQLRAGNTFGSIRSSNGTFAEVLEATGLNITYLVPSSDFVATIHLSVKQVIPGYSTTNPETGLHQDGSTPTHSGLDVVYETPIKVKGALGAPIQALPEFTGEASISLQDADSVSDDGTRFSGKDATLIYADSQLDIVDKIDRKVDCLGDELFENPTTQIVDANNYSEWDPATGIGRIVSDGTYVDLEKSVLNGNAIFDIEILEGSVGSVAVYGGFQNIITESEAFIETITTGFLQVKRNGACNVLFKLLVKQPTRDE